MVKWVNYLVLVLMLSVSTQALSVVFDSHVAHQNSEAHLSDAVHDDEDDENIKRLASSRGTGDNSGLDCQHCCHCHSAQHIFLPMPIKALPGHGHYPVRHKLIPPPTDGYWRNVLRPPIA